jgi:hypothetical protein
LSFDIPALRLTFATFGRGLSGLRFFSLSRW